MAELIRVRVQSACMAAVPKSPTNFPGQKMKKKKITLISRLMEAGIRTRNSTVKEFLFDEQKRE
jgi:hypothetical protein